MLRHGGRNGVALTLGFRWALGKDSTKEKVEKDNVKQMVSNRYDNKIVNAGVNLKTKTNASQTQTPERKVLKQLSPTQRAKLQHSTMTAYNACIK